MRVKSRGRVYSLPRTIDQGPRTEIPQYLVHSQQRVTEALREERRVGGGGGGLLGRGDI